MHQYLSAIGFKNTFPREYEMDLLLDNLFHTFDTRDAVREETPGCAFLEMAKGFGPGMGIKLCGQMDAQGFHRMFYFPYFEREQITTRTRVDVNPRSGGDGFCGLVDDGRVGMSLIFYLQNPVLFKKMSFRHILSPGDVGVTFTALANGGAILLGAKPLRRAEEDLRVQDGKERSHLLTAAKGGDQDAIESLTMDDMDTYAMLSRRIGREDLYSIVETSFMPTGFECDLYRVLGTILFYTKVQNSITKQYVYQLTIECNGIPIDVCVNQQDLLGDPEVGRRFKGTIWLQGRLDFENQSEKEQPRQEAARHES